jgi:hypothetical protein
MVGVDSGQRLFSATKYPTTQISSEPRRSTAVPADVLGSLIFPKGSTHLKETSMSGRAKQGDKLFFGEMRLQGNATTYQPSIFSF